MQFGQEYQKGWYVSHYNFMKNEGFTKLPKKVIIHDNTLREGEQHIGVSFNKEQKKEIAIKLSEAGIPRIEATIIASSEEDRQMLKELSTMNLSSKIFALCRLMKKDVDMAIECGISSIGLIVLANDQYLKTYNKTVDQLINMAIETAIYAKEHGFYVTLMIADASKVDTDRFLKIANTVAQAANIDSVSAMDTFGVFSVEGIENFVNIVTEKLLVPLELHCHNDFGLASANSITAVCNGIETIHTSILGLGERIGNAPTEEVVAILEMLYGVDTGIKIEKLYELVKLVSEYSGIPILSNKTVVGSGINHIVSGLVATEYVRLKEANEGMEKWLFPYLPQTIGLSETELVLGKTSGNTNLDWALEKIDTVLNDEQKKLLLEKVKKVASSEGKLISPYELLEIINTSKFDEVK